MSRRSNEQTTRPPTSTRRWSHNWQSRWSHPPGKIRSHWSQPHGKRHASVYEPNLQFFAYYAVDYSQGFVRRGLGGEILDLFPADLYFTGLLILRWLVPTLFGVGIAAVAWTVAVKFGRSERRLMLALLTPMLPLGFVHAVVLPTPDLIGEAALAVFAVVLASAKGDRSLLAASGLYGMATAVLTLIHEAVPFLQALGAVLAIVVLAHTSVKIQRLSALLAVAPGLVVALTIALLRRRDVSPQCARLPHKAVRWAPGRTPGANTLTGTSTTGLVALSPSQQEKLLSSGPTRSAGPL